MKIKTFDDSLLASPVLQVMEFFGGALKRAKAVLFVRLLAKLSSDVHNSVHSFSCAVVDA